MDSTREKNLYPICNPKQQMRLQKHIIVFVDNLFKRYDVAEWLLNRYGKPEGRWSMHIIDENYVRHVVISFDQEKDLTMFRIVWDGAMNIVPESTYSTFRVKRAIEDKILGENNED